MQRSVEVTPAKNPRMARPARAAPGPRTGTDAGSAAATRPQPTIARRARTEVPVGRPLRSPVRASRTIIAVGATAASPIPQLGWTASTVRTKCSIQKRSPRPDGVPRPWAVHRPQSREARSDAGPNAPMGHATRATGDPSRHGHLVFRTERRIRSRIRWDGGPSRARGGPIGLEDPGLRAVRSAIRPSACVVGGSPRPRQARAVRGEPLRTILLGSLLGFPRTASGEPAPPFGGRYGWTSARRGRLGRNRNPAQRDHSTTPR
jgi:hypothetical protein